MHPIALLIIGGAIVTMSDILLKKWALLHVPMLNIWFFLGIAFGVIGISFLAFAFRSKGLATANMVFVMVNTLALLVAHVFYFQERLTMLQGAGIVLAVFSVFLIEFGDVA